jgi:hypothetical protein
MDRIDAAERKTTLVQFLGTPKTGSVFDQQIAVIRKSEPKLAAELVVIAPQQLPKAAWKQVRDLLTTKDYISGITLLDHAREKLMGLILDPIGSDDSMTIKTLRAITDLKKDFAGVPFGIIINNSSRGSVFETWVRKRWAIFFKDLKNPQKAIPVNRGRTTFYFDVVKDSTGKEISRTPSNLGVVTKNYRTIDGSYVDSTVLVSEGAKCSLVLVEFKHTQGRFEGDVLKQLQDNVKLLGIKTDESDKKIRRIEYIFSTFETATANRLTFATAFSKKTGAIKVYYIDDDNQRQELKIFP